MERKKITFDSFIRGMLIAVVVVAVLWLLRRLSAVLLPFFVAWVLAYLIYPLVSFLQTKLRVRSRVVAVFIALILVAGVITGAFYLFVPPMISEFSRLREVAIAYFTGTDPASNTPSRLTEFLREHIDADFITRLFNQDDPVAAIQQLLPQVWSILSSSISVLMSVVSLFLVLLYVVFILIDYERISSGWAHLIPHKYRPYIARLVNDVKEAMNRYFRGQALVALCVGILFSIGFLIIGFPLAIGLGLFIGLLNMVPYLQVIGLAPTVILAILKAYDTGGNFWIILASALAVFAVVQTIQDGLIVPRIMGKVTGLTPAIILLSLSIWGSLMGMLGMIIALPLTTLLISYYRRFIIDGEDWRQTGM